LAPPLLRDNSSNNLSLNLLPIRRSDFPTILEVANTGYVVQAGSVILEGDIDNLKHSKVAQRAYLGE
jgi:ABC-type lipopolysaccharide export system ATPase subunit